MHTRIIVPAAISGKGVVPQSTLHTSPPLILTATREAGRQPLATLACSRKSTGGLGPQGALDTRSPRWGPRATATLRPHLGMSLLLGQRRAVGGWPWQPGGGSAHLWQLQPLAWSAPARVQPHHRRVFPVAIAYFGGTFQEVVPVGSAWLPGIQGHLALGPPCPSPVTEGVSKHSPKFLLRGRISDNKCKSGRVTSTTKY